MASSGSSSKIIGVSVDFSSCSKAALRWASASLQSGDQLILIHVNSSYQNEQGPMHLWVQSGSPLIPLVEFSDPRLVAKTYGASPDKETLEILAEAAKQEGVEVFAKVFYGDPTTKVCEAVDLAQLSSLVIGNRGLSTLKEAPMGSVSTYIVKNATCPVTVVNSGGELHDMTLNVLPEKKLPTKKNDPTESINSVYTCI